MTYKGQDEKMEVENMEFLVEGHQVLFSQRLANIIGIEEAVMLQQLHYRLQHQGKKKEGPFWYCQTHHSG